MKKLLILLYIIGPLVSHASKHTNIHDINVNIHDVILDTIKLKSDKSKFVHISTIDLIKEILAVGADPNTPYPACNNSPLMTLIEFNRSGNIDTNNDFFKKMNLLVDYGANVNYRAEFNGNCGGDTAMTKALNNCETKVVNFLIAKGYRLDNSEKLQVLKIAIAENNLDLFSEILRSKVKFNSGEVHFTDSWACDGNSGKGLIVGYIKTPMEVALLQKTGFPHKLRYIEELHSHGDTITDDMFYEHVFNQNDARLASFLIKRKIYIPKMEIKTNKGKVHLLEEIEKKTSAENYDAMRSVLIESVPSKLKRTLYHLSY